MIVPGTATVSFDYVGSRGARLIMACRFYRMENCRSDVEIALALSLRLYNYHYEWVGKMHSRQPLPEKPDLYNNLLCRIEAHETPGHSYHNAAAIIYLLVKGGDLDARTHKGKSAREYMTLGGHLGCFQMVKVFMEVTSLHLFPKPIECALNRTLPRNVAYRIHVRASRIENQLFAPSTARMLLEAGADPMEPTFEGKCALDYVAAWREYHHEVLGGWVRVYTLVKWRRANESKSAELVPVKKHGRVQDIIIEAVAHLSDDMFRELIILMGASWLDA